MGIRDMLNAKKGGTTIIALVATVAAVGLAIWRSGGTNGTPLRIEQTFYSSDDGKTYFVDSAAKLPPFDHEGKQAYLAHVFRVDGGKPFVGYLERFSDKLRPRIVEMQTQSNGKLSPELLELMNSAAEVKKPGETQWYSMNSVAGGNITVHVAPAGHQAVGVIP